MFNINNFITREDYFKGIVHQNVQIAIPNLYDILSLFCGTQ